MLRLLAHDLPIATLHGQGMQQAIPDIAYHVSIGGKVAVHQEAFYWILPGLGWGHVACVALAQQQCLPIWPAQ